MQPIPMIVPASHLVRFADLAFEDFELRLRALNRLLESEIARQISRWHRNGGSDAPGISADDAKRLLAGVASLEAGGASLSGLIPLTEAERDRQHELRRRAEETGQPLPLDGLAEDLDLGAFEVDVVLLCVAAEVDRAYGRLFGFIVDNLNRQAPSIELVCALGGPGVRERSGHMHGCAEQELSARSRIPSAPCIRRYRCLKSCSGA
jgi:hypothetical protein